MTAAQQPLRRALPERPRTVIVLAQAIRMKTVGDDQLRKIPADRARVDEPQIHVLVFAREEPEVGARPEFGRVRADALERRAGDHRVAACEHSRKTRTVCLLGETGIRDAEHRRVR